mgnify:CR=1 FL=1
MIRSYKEEQELKEKILELRKKNYPYDKIAMELGTNERKSCEAYNRITCRRGKT